MKSNSILSLVWFIKRIKIFEKIFISKVVLVNKLVVFLDSNEYKRCGHNFTSTPMRKICEVASKESIHLLATTVILRLLNLRLC